MSFNPYNNGQYNVTPPTLTDGQVAPVELDVNGNQKVVVQGTATVSGTVAVSNLPATQNVAVTSAIPAGSNVIGHVVADSGSTTAVTGTVTVDASGHTVPVSGTFWQATQPVSAASLPLPSGASTSAKQPALGTAGTASTDVITVQGVAGMTALKVDGSAVTQPVSGTVTANAGTGSFTVAQATGTNLHVVVDSAPTTAVTGTFWQATQPVSGTVAVSSVSGAVTVQGDSASGASKAGNPVQQGGVFNTTQPTVITGQTVEAQYTARGAAIVATGADTFNATVNTALPAGSNTIGKVDILGNGGATLDAVTTAATAPANGLATLNVYQTSIPVLTAGQSVATQCDTTGATLVNIEGRKATYSAVNVAPATGTTDSSFTAVAGDIAVMPGSATKTIRVTRVEVTLSTSGTAGFATVQLVKRGTADSSGTSATMAVVPHDSNFAAASAVPLIYTAAPTVGTAVGTFRCVRFFDESSTVSGSATWIWEFGTRGGASAIVLRGTAQQLCVNIPAVIGTQTAAVSFEWEEDNS